MGTGSTLALGPPRYRNKRHAQSFRGRFGGRQGNGQNGIGAQFALRLGAVEVEHDAIDRELIQGVHPFQFREDLFRHVLDRLGYAFAQVTFLVTVAQLECFVLAGARSGRNRGAPHRAPGQDDIDFHSWVPTRIEDLARFDLRD